MVRARLPVQSVLPGAPYLGSGVQGGAPSAQLAVAPPQQHSWSRPLPYPAGQQAAALGQWEGQRSASWEQWRGQGYPTGAGGHHGSAWPPGGGSTAGGLASAPAPPFVCSQPLHPQQSQPATTASAGALLLAAPAAAGTPQSLPWWVQPQQSGEAGPESVTSARALQEDAAQALVELLGRARPVASGVASLRSDSLHAGAPGPEAQTAAQPLLGGRGASAPPPPTAVRPEHPAAPVSASAADAGPVAQQLVQLQEALRLASEVVQQQAAAAAAVKEDLQRIMLLHEQVRWGNWGRAGLAGCVRRL